jgi:hypothetical protein
MAADQRACADDKLGGDDQNAIKDVGETTRLSLRNSVDH